ncbi:zinc finger protein 541-like protein, partial [Leptotrombidium deliense]
MSFSFSPHQVQQYHQQQQQQQQQQQSNNPHSLPSTPNDTSAVVVSGTAATTTQFTYFNDHTTTTSHQQQTQNLDDIYVNESDSNHVNFDETDFEMDVAFMEQMDKDNQAETQELFNFNNQNVEFMNNLISSVCQTTTTATSLIQENSITTTPVKKDDDVFVNPANVLNTPPLKKLKKSENILAKEDEEEQHFKRMKHRPEPLYIPPYLNNCDQQQPPQTARFQIKSPRISHPLSGKMASSQNYSPPPYTPPPMLSPVRTISGLYWHIISGAGTPIQVNATPSTTTPPVLATPIATIQQHQQQQQQQQLQHQQQLQQQQQQQHQTPTVTVQTPYEDYIFVEEVQPHVNIGECFQARIPRYNPNREYRKTNDVKVWDPCILTIDEHKEDDLNKLIEFGCSGCCVGGGRNEEFVHHLFYMFHGDFEKCLLYLMKPFQIKLKQQEYLNNYKYNETSKWNRNEIELYYQALIQAHKDFHAIAKIVSTKSVKECVEFYYLWKKVCPEEYKRLRIIRRKKEEEGIYWRKKEQQQQQRQQQT